MKKLKAQAFLLLIISLLSALCIPVSAATQESSNEAAYEACIAYGEVQDRNEDIYEAVAVPRSEASKVSLAALSDRRIASRFYELIFGKAQKKSTDRKVLLLCPAGDAFGVKISGSGIRVTHSGSEQENESCPLIENDKIVKIDGKEVYTVDEVKKLLNASGGKSLNFTVEREGKTLSIPITPTKLGECYRLGVSITDGTTGIGTITYFDPQTQAFGGLGHGICDGKTGKVLNMTGGEATTVILGGAVKGEAGAPGELRGVLTEKSIGTVLSNTECGIFGYLTPEACQRLSAQAEPIEIGTSNEVREGEATIISTVKSGKSQAFKIEINDIDRSSDGSKSFRIKVSDPTLIALTGGIVRGMSGSPIIQDGKLIGAVTHVMVADPTEGYGIFIENMLNAADNANNSSQKAA